MRQLVIAAVWIAAALAPVAAQAAVVVVDTFDTGDQFVFDTTIGGGGVSGTVGNRTVTHELLQGSNEAPPFQGFQSNVRVAGSATPPGILAVANTDGRDSQVSISWTLPAGFLSAAGDGGADVVFDLLFSDQDVEARLFFDGVLFGALILPSYDQATPDSRKFALTPAQYSAIAGSADKVLRLQLDGPVAWDMRLDNLRFEIPEPGGLPVVLAALAALAAVRRRRAR